MKNYTLLCLFFLLLAVQFSHSASLNFTFDNIIARWFPGGKSQESKHYKPRELNVEAHFIENNNILITFEELNKVGNFTLKTSQFLYTGRWDTYGWIRWREGFGPITKFDFFFNKTFNTSSVNDVCVKIDNTDDTLCYLGIITYIRRVSGYHNRMNLYLRVENSTGKPSIKLFGGMHERSPTGSIIQTLDVRTDMSTLGSTDVYGLNLKLYIQEAPRFAHERVIRMENHNTSFLNLTRPQYMYFECKDFQKMVNYTDEDIRKGHVTINLAELGLPFDKERTCTFAVFFTDLSSGNNLISMPSIRRFAIGPDPNSNHAVQNLALRGLKALIHEAGLRRI